MGAGPPGSARCRHERLSAGEGARPPSPGGLRCGGAGVRYSPGCRERVCSDRAPWRQASFGAWPGPAPPPVVISACHNAVIISGVKPP